MESRETKQLGLAQAHRGPAAIALRIVQDHTNREQTVCSDSVGKAIRLQGGKKGNHSSISTSRTIVLRSPKGSELCWGPPSRFRTSLLWWQSGGVAKMTKGLW
jgi:hypothetical protein